MSGHRSETATDFTRSCLHKDWTFSLPPTDLLRQEIDWTSGTKQLFGHHFKCTKLLKHEAPSLERFRVQTLALEFSESNKKKSFSYFIFVNSYKTSCWNCELVYDNLYMRSTCVELFLKSFVIILLQIQYGRQSLWSGIFQNAVTERSLV